METNTTDEGNATSIKGLDSYTNNPFLEDLKQSHCVEARKKYTRDNKELVDQTTGEVLTIPIVTTDAIYYFNDRCKFIKIFNSADNYLQIANLSTYGTYMFWFIMSILKPNSDIVVVNPSEFSGFSKASNKMAYYQGILELANKDFIAKISPTTYFINYTKFINGNRTDFLGSPEDMYYEKYGKKL